MHPALGPADPAVSRPRVGCMSMAGTYRLADAHEAAATLLESLDSGVTMFDTGDIDAVVLATGTQGARYADHGITLIGR